MTTLTLTLVYAFNSSLNDDADDVYVSEEEEVTPFWIFETRLRSITSEIMPGLAVAFVLVLLGRRAAKRAS